MRNVFAVTAVLALLGLGIAAQADVFNLGAGYTNLETVAVGDPGNAADTITPNPGYGSVGYNYHIGKYEVTAKQYTDFLNAKAQTDTYGLYNTNMWSSSYGCKIEQSGGGTVDNPYSYAVASDYANRPVNYVSYWDSCRFANWLGNGQGDGDTETGAYTLNGYNDWDGRTIQRNAGWKWAVTSEDEWYKAAYYKGGGLCSLYANGTSTAPVAGTASNYNMAIGHTWDGSTNGALEQNGTKDMMGNVWEWNEAIVDQDVNYACRGVRGGSFYGSLGLQSSVRANIFIIPDDEYDFNGFRVSEVPEPSSIITLLGGLAGLLGIRRRRA